MQVDQAKKPKEIEAAIAAIADGMKAIDAARKYGVNRTNIWRAERLNDKIKSAESIIEARYPTENTKELAKELGIAAKTLQKRASMLGVSKCPIFIAKEKSESLKKNPHRLKVKRPKKITSGQRGFIAVYQHNIESLLSAGYTELAILTAGIIEKIQDARMSQQDINFDFLTIRKVWD